MPLTPLLKRTDERVVRKVGHYRNPSFQIKRENKKLKATQLILETKTVKPTPHKSTTKTSTKVTKNQKLSVHPVGRGNNKYVEPPGKNSEK